MINGNVARRKHAENETKSKNISADKTGKQGQPMYYEEKKVAKIIEELTIFFFASGADKMSSGIEQNGDEVKITFHSNYLTEYEHNIHSIEKYLNEPKNEAIEDVYWELAGSGEPGESSQLLLVGMMIDRYELKKYKNEIELVLYKKMW